MDASTHRGSICRSYGGVGRNLADGLSRLGRRPLFLSAVGDDESGEDLIRHNPSMVSLFAKVKTRKGRKKSKKGKKSTSQTE